MFINPVLFLLHFITSSVRNGSDCRTLEFWFVLKCVCKVLFAVSQVSCLVYKFMNMEKKIDQLFTVSEPKHFTALTTIISSGRITNLGRV